MADLGIDADVAAGLAHEAEHLRQAEAGALAGPLVVKNGSNARAITSGGMPEPVSLTAIITNCPGSISASRA